MSTSPEQPRNAHEPGEDAPAVPNPESGVGIGAGESSSFEPEEDRGHGGEEPVSEPEPGAEARGPQ